MKENSAIQIFWALGAMAVGGFLVWTLYFSKQASHTTLLSAHEHGASYDIKKNERDEWALEINGAQVATLSETHNAAPMYSFKVGTSTIKAPAVGGRFDIRAVGSDQTLICTNCIQDYIKLPASWNRIE